MLFYFVSFAWRISSVYRMKSNFVYYSTFFSRFILINARRAKQRAKNFTVTTFFIDWFLLLFYKNFFIDCNTAVMVMIITYYYQVEKKTCRIILYKKYAVTI
jgi:hypothetical protein